MCGRTGMIVRKKQLRWTIYDKYPIDIEHLNRIDRKFVAADNVESHQMMIDDLKGKE